MSRYIYQGSFCDQSGNSVASGTVEVYLAGTTTAASVYIASSGGTAVNSVTSASNGKFYFYVDTVDYNMSQKFKLSLVKTNYVTTASYDDIVIFPEFEYDYYANASATDQSVDANDNSLADLLAEIGTTDIRTIVCKPGTYTFSTTKDWSTYTNVTFKIQPGADFAVDAGVTVTIGCKIDVGLQKWISLTGTGVITFSVGSIEKTYPQWWGAKCDDSTTDTTAIQNAVNSLSAGVVIIANGTCLSDTITLKDNVYLYIAGGATLKQKGTGAARLINIEDVSNTGVFGEGTIDGNSALSGTFNAHCIRIYAGTKDVDNVFVKGLTIKNASATGTANGDCINITGTSDSSFIPKNIRVSNTYCYNPDRNGITVITGKNITIVDNIIVDHSQTGIHLEHGATQTINNVSITGNIIENINSGQKGLHLTGTDITAKGNIIRNVSIHGILCGSSSFADSNVSDNVIETSASGSMGIDVGIATRILISNNNIEYAQDYGIFLKADSSYIKVTGNYIRANSNAIVVNSSSAGYHFIDGNTLEKLGAGNVAINLADTPYNIVGINQIIGYTTRIQNIASTSFIASRGDAPVTHINSKTVADHNTALTAREAGLILIDTSGGVFTLILPDCPYTCLGISYTFKKTDSSVNAFTIDGNGADTIDGAATNTEMDAQHDTITVTSDTGGTWRITQRWIH